MRTPEKDDFYTDGSVELSMSWMNRGNFHVRMGKDGAFRETDGQVDNV